MSEPASAPGRGVIVPRPRLFALLDDGARRPVTVVQAGPGWGKTTSVAYWVGGRPGAYGWLSLTPRHRAVSVLRTAVAGVLEPAGVQVDDGCAEGSRQPVTLVLDDLQVLDGSPAAADLAAFVDNRHAWLRFLLISRTEPALPLHRLRAAGELTEIGAADLAFTADEAPGLDPATIERTEGWPLGMRLAVEARRPEEAARDYLLREVVDAQPPPVRSFLLRTSFPDLICADLAAALTGEAHGEQILDHLERGTGFVRRCADDPRWYRYHHQLRDALRRQFEVDEPEATAALHGLIARWYAQERMAVEALRHARLAGDWAYVGRVVAEQAIVLLVSAHSRELFDTLRRIPADLLPTTPELCLCAALLMVDGGNQPGIRGQILRARRLLDGRDPEQRLAIDAALAALEAAAVIRVSGDMPWLTAATTGLLETLRPARLDQVPAMLQFRALALTNKGVGLLWTATLDQADQYFWAGMAAARTTGVPLVEINAQGYLGLVAYLQGSLTEAEQHAAAAEELADRLGAASAPQAAMAHLVIALVEVERSRTAEAQSALRRALHSDIDPPEAITAMLTSLVRAQLLLSAGDPAAARALLKAARDGAPPSLDAPRLDRWLRLTEGDVSLALNEPDRVVAMYRSEPALRPAEQVCLGRAYLALGDYPSAEELLTRAGNSPDMVAAVTAWIALALLAEAQGHVSRSIDAMSKAGTLGRRNGIRRPFRRFDPARIAVLIGRQRWLEEDDTTGPVVFEKPPRAEAVALAEPLSERELDVLRFLPTVLTANEIAASLGISVNTVKAHMRAIYRKLGATRRREAVVRARQLGLL
ncbi:LuxR C-terminal-related transcriptional regulator [Actinoplanes sp. KI2]|uniref:LuxR C-terminal-related transcriptional regulator n=1 Tax=Actinoplanes sp. KI2 TaxID=2983315 RepID=UPI0021D5A83F|nr:LuxR C-terminal-related transcriptional regulator [Actinoplanes sp. KI2]MCU7726482.1 LuxR C-terminal-related transcriptional regulator [Actinoplanes sp. KI2]